MIFGIVIFVMVACAGVADSIHASAHANKKFDRYEYIDYHEMIPPYQTEKQEKTNEF